MKDIFPRYRIGDFINQPTNPTEFEIMRFDDMEEPQVDDVHKHTFYEIIWIEQGNSMQTIDYKTYEIAPCSLFFISPNQVHEFEVWQPLKGGSILFTEEFFLLGQNNKDRLFEMSFLDNFYSNPGIHLATVEFDDIKMTIDQLTKEQKRIDKIFLITQGLLHVLLAQIQRFIDKTKKDDFSKTYLVLYKKFKCSLNRFFMENKSASYYADQLHITAHHLNKVVKKITGKTTGEVIRARSILEAKRMLTFSDATISEISTALQFFDSSYFAKTFKADCGMSPLEFKSKMSEKYRKG